MLALYICRESVTDVSDESHVPRSVSVYSFKTAAALRA